MATVILVRYGEIGLKGRNRPAFEKRLVANIRRALGKEVGADVRSEYGRIVVDFGEAEAPRWALERICSVFGVVSASPAVSVPLSLEAAEKAAVALVDERCRRAGRPLRFKVEARRSNKRFPLTSPEINARLGTHVLKHASSPPIVDVHDPDFVLSVEVRERAIYLYTEVVAGPGGLPVGSSSSGLLLLSGGIDSPVAGWLAMKRGIRIEAVHFHSFPFTSERSKEKVIDLTAVLSRCSFEAIPLYVVNFTPAQTAIRQVAPAEMGITLMRRMMLRIAERLARERGIPALITGESVGQVASQTLESMAAINEVTSMPILRPLVTMDKAEIIALAERIGTYELSILPYADCCTVFVPERPETRPKLERVHRVEERLPIEELVSQAVSTVERLEPAALARA